MSLRRRALMGKQLPPPVQLAQGNLNVPFDRDSTGRTSHWYIFVSDSFIPTLGGATLYSNHKYYFRATFNYTSQDTFYGLYWTNWQDVGAPDFRRSGHDDITFPKSNRVLSSVYFYGIAPNKHLIGTLTLIVIDLTATYGAGNEPTTVEQVRQDYPNDYYPYNPSN